MAGRYKDALPAMERQTPDNFTRNAWVQPAASFAVVERGEETRATLGEVLTCHPDLTIERFVNDPSVNGAEREHLIRTVRSAGFPAWLKPEAFTRLAQPVRLPECAKS